MRNYDISATTVNDSSLLEFPTFETDEDKMVCSNSAPTGEPHDESKKCKNSDFTNSFSQNL